MVYLIRVESEVTHWPTLSEWRHPHSQCGRQISSSSASKYGLTITTPPSTKYVVCEFGQNLQTMSMFAWVNATYLLVNMSLLIGVCHFSHTEPYVTQRPHEPPHCPHFLHRHPQNSLYDQTPQPQRKSAN